jgi:hypothetical protein
MSFYIQLLTAGRLGYTLVGLQASPATVATTVFLSALANKTLCAGFHWMIAPRDMDVVSKDMWSYGKLLMTPVTSIATWKVTQLGLRHFTGLVLPSISARLLAAAVACTILSCLAWTAADSVNQVHKTLISKCNSKINNNHWKVTAPEEKDLALAVNSKIQAEFLPQIHTHINEIRTETQRGTEQGSFIVKVYNLSLENRLPFMQSNGKQSAESPTDLIFGPFERVMA